MKLRIYMRSGNSFLVECSDYDMKGEKGGSITNLMLTQSTKKLPNVLMPSLDLNHVEAIVREK